MGASLFRQTTIGRVGRARLAVRAENTARGPTVAPIEKVEAPTASRSQTQVECRRRRRAVRDEHSKAIERLIVQGAAATCSLPSMPQGAREPRASDLPTAVLTAADDWSVIRGAHAMRRTVVIDANVINSLNRGSVKTAKALKSLIDSGATVFISQRTCIVRQSTDGLSRHLCLSSWSGHPTARRSARAPRSSLG